MSIEKFSAILKTHVVSIRPGAFSANSFGGTIRVEAVDNEDNTVRLRIDGDWFDAADLREAAELFTAMADALS